MQIETIGNATLYCGDCLEVMTSLKSGQVQCVMTDPPYSTPTVASFGRKVVKRLSDLAIQEHYFGVVRDHVKRLLGGSGPVFVFCDDAYYPVLFSLFYGWQQTNLLIWDKGRIGMGNPFRRQHELIFYANDGSAELSEEIRSISTVMKYTLTKEYHAAEKPVPLLSLLIKGLTKQLDTVIDPFMGSCSTGVAALAAGRKFIGIELEQEYFDIACKRLEQSTSQGQLAL